MALYAALTFWLLVIMFSAWGVYSLLTRLIKPRVVNAVLLPGTLVAQLGHVLGLLLSGNSVQNTRLMGDDEEGKPESESPDEQRLPVIGPILVGLLPLVACAVCLYFVAVYLGRGVLMHVPRGAASLLPQSLPTAFAGVWDLLHSIVNLLEGLVGAIFQSNLTHWSTILFLYLSICLTVRMAPFESNRRGTIGAVVLAAIVIAVLSSLISPVRAFIESSWPILTFAVGILLFLLLLTLVITGVVQFVRVLVKGE